MKDKGPAAVSMASFQKMQEKDCVFSGLAALLAILICILQLACAHNHPVVPLVPREFEGGEEIRVRIGINEVKLGDKVDVFRSDCPQGSEGTGKRKCTKTKIGEALVVRVINLDDSIVRLDPRISSDQVSHVEKKW